MNVDRHAKINIFCNIIHLAAPIFMFIVPFWPLSATVMLILLAFFSPLIFTWCVPVCCTRLKCAGRMWMITPRSSFWRVRLHYRCDCCGTEHKVVILKPGLKLEPVVHLHEVWNVGNGRINKKGGQPVICAKRSVFDQDIRFTANLVYQLKVGYRNLIEMTQKVRKFE